MCNKKAITIRMIHFCEFLKKTKITYIFSSNYGQFYSREFKGKALNIRVWLPTNHQLRFLLKSVTANRPSNKAPENINILFANAEKTFSPSAGTS
jgi:hypothetical protein